MKPPPRWQQAKPNRHEELTALFDRIPTERQKAYQASLDQEVKRNNIISDQGEIQLLELLVEKYRTEGRVPVGSHWVKASSRIQELAARGETVEVEEDGSATPNPLLVLGFLGVLLACVVIFFISQVAGGGEAEATEAPQAIYSPTPRQTRTPTPIALEEQDRIIRDGDAQQPRRQTIAYPVALHIYPPQERQPRVFVVQRRAVEYSEWEYDPNPDIASVLAGMDVRRIVGIPFSDDNEDLFDRLGAGARFQLVMNTGSVLEYQFNQATEIRRSDVSALRQTSPGLVLLLIGETDDDQPSATRRMVTGYYDPVQETSREGAILSTVPDFSTPIPATATPIIPTATAIPARDLLRIELVSVLITSSGIETQLRLYNTQPESVFIYPDEDIAFASGYSPNPDGPWLPAANASGYSILPGQALDLTIVWAMGNEPYASLRVLKHLFSFTLSP